MNNTRAGKFRVRIEIRNPPSDTTRDSFGARVGNGSTVATVWAEKTDWSGNEQDEAGRDTAIVITKWRIRYRTDVTPKMEIVDGSVVYEILSVLDFDGKKRELTIESKKVTS